MVKSQQDILYSVFVFPKWEVHIKSIDNIFSGGTSILQWFHQINMQSWLCIFNDLYYVKYTQRIKIIKLLEAYYLLFLWLDSSDMVYW